MDEYRDSEIGRSIAELPTPVMSDGFMARLRAGLADSPHGRNRRRRRMISTVRRLPRRRAALIVALCIVAATPAVVFGALRGSPSPAEVARNTLKQWTASVANSAKVDQKPTFAQADETAIASKVRRYAGEFHYKAERVSVLPGRDGAPLIILRYTGSSLASFSKALPALEGLLDPRSDVPNIGIPHDTYEAFFLEAVDSKQTPFLLVWNVWRQPDGGGGQWASSESLLPYLHF